MLLGEVPFAEKVWALLFLRVRCPAERSAQERKVRHRKLTARASQAMLLIARRLVGRKVIIVADATFSAPDLLAQVKAQVTRVTRLRLDAALYAPVPERPKGQLGRARKKGQRLERLKDVAANPKTRREPVLIRDWYGAGERAVELGSSTCGWLHLGKAAVPMRWVLRRAPAGRFETPALRCTDLAVASRQNIERFIKRRQVAVTFAESHRHLGLETRKTMV